MAVSTKSWLLRKGHSAIEQVPGLVEHAVRIVGATGKAPLLFIRQHGRLTAGLGAQVFALHLINDLVGSAATFACSTFAKFAHAHKVLGK